MGLIISLKDRKKNWSWNGFLENPGIYLDELQLKLQHFTGIFISLTTIFKTIRQLGFMRKMIRHVVHCQDELRRCEFMEEMSYLDPDMIIWIEMSSDHRQSSWQLGHHLRGLTPTDTVISIRGQRLSTIAAMSTRGINDFEVYNGTTNGETIAGFVQRCTVPIMLSRYGPQLTGRPLLSEVRTVKANKWRLRAATAVEKTESHHFSLDSVRTRQAILLAQMTIT